MCVYGLMYLWPALQALMGKAKALEVKNECKSALEVIREVIPSSTTWTILSISRFSLHLPREIALLELSNNIL